MTAPSSIDKRRTALEEALRLIQGSAAGGGAPDRSGSEPPWVDLLAECEASLDAVKARPFEPLRTVHHFACTGGTLVCKALAALPNVLMMSEVDPLSTLHLRALKRPFFPTDLIADLHYNPRIASESTASRMFQVSLAVLKEETDATGLHMVLRDHPHSRFCDGALSPEKPSLREIAGDVAPVLSVVTVRHPLASFLSLRRNNWVHFTPDSIEEYCRRYLAFLDAHEGLPIFRYEDFTTDPVAILASIAEALQLAFSDTFADRLSLFHLSGDSGRTSLMIEPRPPSPVPEDLLAQSLNSMSYAELLSRLQYSKY